MCNLAETLIGVCNCRATSAAQSNATDSQRVATAAAQDMMAPYLGGAGRQQAFHQSSISGLEHPGCKEAVSVLHTSSASL